MKIDPRMLDESIKILVSTYDSKLKEIRQKIKVLHGKFEKRVQDRVFATRHETSFGLFFSEYVLNLPLLDIKTPIDTILLNARRLCEALIVIKHFNLQNNFEEMVLFCDRDWWEYLEGSQSWATANEALFVELQNMPDMNAPFRKELENLKSKYNGKKPIKMPNIKQMAEVVGLEEEYKYFYKLSSKILHFCPFSFNGDLSFEAPIHKIIFLMRFERYLEKIKEELDKVYEKTKLKN